MYGLTVALATLSTAAAMAPPFRRTVDLTYPYTGPAVPIADIVDQTVNGNGKGFPRLYEAPAVEPDLGTVPTNNINVISLAYIPDGMTVHFQTPYGIGTEPFVYWGTDPFNLNNTATGWTTTYDRTPPCSMVHTTQCSQFFHNVAITNLAPATKYYYQIPGGNGTKASPLQHFTTGRAAGDETPFTSLLVCDMGYTNAKGTHLQMLNALADDAQFVIHGGDISYADETFEGIAPCDPIDPSLPLNSTQQQICYNGSLSTLPGGVDDSDYYNPLPQGEVPNGGGPNGGDASTMYEPNWDIWQQWMGPITKTVPYMTAPGNHEAACASGDNTNFNETTAVLVDNLPPGSSAPASNLSYWSCPPSQRNFTAYRHRFNMPGNNSLEGGDTKEGGGNMWYSFTYGLAKFIVFDGETDYPSSPEVMFKYLLKGNETVPKEEATVPRDSGPFGEVNGNITLNESYEQWRWMKNELANVDRSVTPWLIAISHRPMYSSVLAGYLTHMRNAWEDMFLEAGVDIYVSGHQHFWERMKPMGRKSTINDAAIIDDHTYATSPNVSMVHIINGQGGNVESHDELDGAPLLNLTAVLDTEYYGFCKFQVLNRTVSTLQFIKGEDGSVGDYLTVVKQSS